MFPVLNPIEQEMILKNAHQANGYSPLSTQALKLYRQALLRGKWARLWARVSKRSVSLLDLNSLRSSLKVHGQHDTKSQAVLISQIRGTEGRVKDFDSSFNPVNEKTRSRWLSIATARLENVSLPAVELIQVGSLYFVRDGHHRISVARALGEQAIDAHVTVLEVNNKLPGLLTQLGCRCETQYLVLQRY